MKVQTFVGSAAMLCAIGLSSCGGLSPDPLEAHREVGVDGQHFTLDELQAIADDDELTDDEKRQRFAEMGIEDADLQDALLNL